jgi:hypothetical protein
MTIVVRPFWQPVPAWPWYLDDLTNGGLVRRENGRARKFRSLGKAIAFVKRQPGLELFDPQKHTELKEKLLRAWRGETNDS